jgi:hypothetical protein
VICLHCEARLPDDRPQVCPGCQYPHQPREPIAGVNHVSQLLAALDALRAGDLEVEELEGILEVFLGLFESFEQKWRGAGKSLSQSLIPSLQDHFGSTLAGIDQALDEGFRALEILQSLEPDFSDDTIDEAEAALLAFFQATCSHAAKALDDFDGLKAQLQSSGAFFNLRSK